MSTKNIPVEALHFEAPVNVAASDAETEAHRFQGVAYSGHEITGHWYWGKVIFDVGSIAPLEKNIAALVGHDRMLQAGSIDKMSVQDGALIVEGALSKETQAGREIAAVLREGIIPQQMSVHISPGTVEEVKEGTQLEVNGNMFSGPGFVFRNSTIKEVSFTPTGWDDKTSARAMSQAGGEVVHFNDAGDSDMDQTEKDKFEKQIADLNSKFETMQTQFTAEKERADNAEAALAAERKERRTEEVKSLFSAMGREFSEEAAQPYINMEAEVFAAVAADLKKAKPEPDASLFGEQAVDGKQPDGDDTVIEQMASL